MNLIAKYSSMFLNRKIFSFFLLIIPTLFLFVLPFTIHAQAAGSGGKTGIVWECTGGSTGRAGDCDFYKDLIPEVINIVNFGTVTALLFTVIVIAFAGWKYMISGPNPGKRSEANQTLLKCAIGIAVILGAWLIVHLITSTLLNSSIPNLI